MRLRAHGAWTHGRDDTFGILGIERSEIRHSAAIAWLFDPCGRHGLGDCVLAGFLHSAFGEEQFDGLTHARVRCEVAEADCRADIIVEAPGLKLVVENKVDADEGPRQCDTLFERFVGARHVFLTPNGRAPETATGAAAAAFRTVSYRDLRKILQRSLLNRPSDGPGRHVAEDYLRTLKREFP